MPGVGPFLASTPGVLGMLGLASMEGQNLQQKAAEKDRANQQALAQSRVSQNQQSALGSMRNYLGANPGPVQAGGAPRPPLYSGANVPMVPGPQLSGNPEMLGGQLPPAVIALLQQAQGRA